MPTKFPVIRFLQRTSNWLRLSLISAWNWRPPPAYLTHIDHVFVQSSSSEFSIHTLPENPHHTAYHSGTIKCLF
jgi:hypothetical protein